MNEQVSCAPRIAAGVKKAISQKKRMDMPSLRRSLAGMIRDLRAHYSRVSGNLSQEPENQWLCDNYYVLEKECKQSMRDIQKITSRASSGELEILYCAVEHVFCDIMPPVTDENVTCFLKELSKRSGLGENQFAFFPVALKAAFIKLAWRACIKTHDEAEISYGIRGFLKLPGLDMEAIVSESSGVEKILMQDPSGTYPLMTPESRSHYRYLVARISAKNRVPEAQTASGMLARARKSDAMPMHHIGWHILNDPRVSAPRRRRGTMAIAAHILLPFICSCAAAFWMGNIWLSALLYIPLWEILRPLLWQISLAGVDIDFLPRMELDKLADKPATVVLVSTLLPKANDAPRLSKRLEQLYFSNSDPDMYYCVLADFKECDFPSDEQDEAQTTAAKNAVEELNKLYGNRFMLFLRSRTYNKTQNKYSGWERKRGAITEFIRFLKNEKTSVCAFCGDAEILPEIKFIIALDADTDLLYESAQTLVSVAAHPLNRPQVDENGIVRSGYGILCPKISTDLQSAKSTPFSRVMSGCGGVTAYETRDKDFYQDLFGESIFAGKGLIDIESFYSCLSDRFPDNQVLSHDILEGAYLRCGFVSDAEMSDAAPTSMTSWLARLHRWLRGDWQNIIFLGRRFRSDGRTWENPVSFLSKYKLFDNLRRSLACVAALACVVLALAPCSPRQRLVLALAGILAVSFPSLWAALNSLASGGLFTLSRKFFTRSLPHFLELAAQGLILLIMLPAQAIATLDAVVRSLWRTFISRKKMLEWTTAAQSDAREITAASVFRRFWMAELFGILFLLAAIDTALVLPGALFAAVIPAAMYTARRSAEETHTLSDKDKDTLLSYNAAMWRYYEDFADEANHFLPPDNIQQSPVYRVANRTSPTNIGFLLLAALIARDLGFIDTDGLYRRIERTLGTVEKLKTWNGNLYNWYDTLTLETLKPEFVSTVDCGNFICCLVALKEGLREYSSVKRPFSDLIKRIDNIIASSRLDIFYDKRKELFSIGWDAEAEKLVDSHYDFLMSEARLTSYYAVARKIVGKKHWGSLARTMSRNGSYAGPVSWTGTMFEYFMPHLLLPVYDGSLLGEALTYCLYCQKKRVKRGIPWGISESAFYAFDNNLNYQYKAHGVQKIGVKRRLDSELVISPYSTFLTIPMNPNSSMRNLGGLREVGVYGRYGFYEAVDFTEERVGKDSLAVTRSYMAHHIGMSMAASANALLDNILQKRFMRDQYMMSANEFLQEKIAKNTIVYDEIKSGQSVPGKDERPKLMEERAGISPLSPECVLLSNGELTDILTDTGAGYLKFGTIDLTRRGTDLPREAQGFIAIAKSGGVMLPATMSPFYDAEATYSVERQEQAVTFSAAKKGLETSMRCVVHPTISCEQRQFTVKNTSSKKALVDVLFYFEPVLCANQDYSAHPAYSKLFVTSGMDSQATAVIFRRRGRDGSENMFLTVGFLEDIDFTFETRREALMSAPDGLMGLAAHVGEKLENSAHGVPDACMAVSFSMSLPAGAKQTATLLICASGSYDEGVEAIISMRNLGLLEPRYAAKPPMPMDSLEGRLSSLMLGQLLFSGAGAETAEDRQKNTLAQDALWGTGISGDLPIALIERPDETGADILESYIKLHGSLRGLNVEFDLCIICGDNSQYENALRLVDKNSGRTVLNARGGIFLLRREALSDDTLTLLRAAARHIAIRGGGLPAGNSQALYTPIRIEPSHPAKMPDNPDLTVTGGCFSGGAFYVNRSKGDSPLPWCHILANKSFGTLLSDRALGYTWAVNSRESKLTPWYNDICADNRGEMLILRDGGIYTDLVNGSLASFSADSAVYDGRSAHVKSHTQVTIEQDKSIKCINITLTNTGKKAREILCAYYIEPVLGVNRDTARYVRAELHGNATLILHNPYSMTTSCRAAISATADIEHEIGFMTNREAFLSGDWDAVGITPENSPCAAAIISLTLPPESSTNISFSLSAQSDRPDRPEAGGNGVDTQADSHIIVTPDKHLDMFINHFAPHQILASRIYGRCAFYQCGGAYGFRDQLQDVCAYVLIDPGITREQILRCCSVQFPEGDVLHWWHELPEENGGIKGVRTKFSDDLLWLPLAAAEYAAKTGDMGIFAEKTAYITAEILGNGEHERYIAPAKLEIYEDVYTHCVKALEKGHNLGEKGLPLIGCGDWNDGFSSVGLKGKGESVWLALFLAHVLKNFAPICAALGDAEYEKLCLSRAEALLAAVDEHCWDGSWYVRAFYDDGSKMGARKNDECAIDLLPQSFAAIAGMPDITRKGEALDSAYKRLIDKENRVVKLFDPPFRHSAQNPGYVKAYPSGIRENGGQYTHAAIWFALGLLKNGDADRAWEILQMLNPVSRASDPALAGKYKLEPYYMAADVYSSPHAYAHGGWSMYTGAASWYYRVVIEDLIGLKMRGDNVTFEPGLPSHWDECSIDSVVRGTTLNVTIKRGGEAKMTDNGNPAASIPLDGKEHRVIISIVKPL